LWDRIRYNLNKFAKIGLLPRQYPSNIKNWAFIVEFRNSQSSIINTQCSTGSSAYIAGHQANDKCIDMMPSFEENVSETIYLELITSGNTPGK